MSEVKYAVELLTFTPHPERLIERAGRICHGGHEYDCDDSRACGFFCRRLIKMKHLSVLEHASATFLFTGVSRAMTHQLVRHRLMSYSQRSQRYVREDGFDYILPVGQNSPAHAEFVSAMEYMQAAYTRLIRFGLLPEDSRFVLPNACATEIVVTANFRQWRHVLEERMSLHAQWEIRAVCRVVYEELRRIAPSCFDDLQALYDAGKVSGEAWVPK
jgi:thymidylate synthase (FAD)